MPKQKFNREREIMLRNIVGVILSGVGVTLLAFKSDTEFAVVLGAAILGLTLYHNMLKILSTPIAIIEEGEDDKIL